MKIDKYKNPKINRREMIKKLPKLEELLLVLHLSILDSINYLLQRLKNIPNKRWI